MKIKTIVNFDHSPGKGFTLAGTSIEVEKSGQLIECVNPAHLYFGSIHYIQPDCVGKWQIADSDESWQASEALLKR